MATLPIPATSATNWIQNGSYENPYYFDPTVISSLLEASAQIGNLIPALPSLDSDTYVRNYTPHFTDLKADHAVKNVSSTGTEVLNSFSYRANRLESCVLRNIIRIGEKYALPELKTSKIDIYDELNKMSVALANGLEDACVGFITASANQSITVPTTTADNDAYSSTVLPIVTAIRKAGSNFSNVVVCISPYLHGQLMKSESYMKACDLTKQEIMRGFVGIIQGLAFITCDRLADYKMFSIDLSKIQRRFYDWTKLNISAGNSNDYEMIYVKYLQYYSFIVQGASTSYDDTTNAYVLIPSDSHDGTIWNGTAPITAIRNNVPGQRAADNSMINSFNFYSFDVQFTTPTLNSSKKVVSEVK